MINSFEVRFLTLTIAFIAVAQRAEAEGATQPPDPFPYVSEEQFIIESVKLQQSDIRKRAIPRLQNTYPSFVIPRVEIGKSGRARRAEARINGIILERVAAIPGTKQVGSELRNYYFDMDWTQGGGVFVALQPSNYTILVESYKTTYLGAKVGMIVNPVGTLYWNCGKDIAKLTLHNSQEEKTSETNEQTKEKEATEVVRVKSDGGIEWKGGHANAEAEFTKTLRRRYVESVQHQREVTNQKSVDREFVIPPFSAKEQTASSKLETRAYRVEGAAILDTEIGVAMPGVYGWPRTIGRWSDFVPEARKRMIPLSATVFVDYEQNTEDVGSVRTFRDADECNQQKTAERIFATGSVPPADAEAQSKGSIVATPEPARIQLMKPLKLAVTTTGSQLESANTALPTRRTSSVCRADASGAASLSGSEAAVRHTVHIAQCPFKRFHSDGRALFRMKVIDSTDREVDLTGFEVRWRDGGGPSFSVNDSEAINLRGVKRISDVGDYYFTDCTCRSDD